MKILLRSISKQNIHTYFETRENVIQQIIATNTTCLLKN
jgi:hypothetical protein